MTSVAKGAGTPRAFMKFPSSEELPPIMFARTAAIHENPASIQNDFQWMTCARSV